MIRAIVSSRPSRRAAALALAAAALVAAFLASRATGEPIALVGATVHPASGPAIENATVVMDGGRITAVGANVTPPAGAKVVPCQGKHVWPGFVAPFTTLGLVEVNSVRGTNDISETGAVNPNVRAEIAINPESDLLPVTRVNGVTSALVVPRGGAIAGTSALVHLDGWTYEDMTVRAPVALHVNWPAMGINRSPFETRSEEEQKRQRDRNLKEIRGAFGDARAYQRARSAQGKNGVPRHDQDVKWDAMAKALKGEIPVVFHGSSLAQIEAILRFADEEKLTNVVLADGYDAWRVADELKRRNIAVITGAPQSLPQRIHESYDAAMALPGKLAKAGVRFCISDGGGETYNARNLPYEAAMAVGFGLSREDALRAITLYPAQIFGVGDRLGSIEPGKVADVVVGDGDPLEITTHVEQVYLAGKPTSMETRHSRLFQKYDSRPRGAKSRPR